jgi:hypothetical protein
MAALTIPALRQAIETRDGQTLAGFYADDAVLQVIDQDNPPSNPREVKGRDAITAYYTDVCGRTMTHHIDNAVAAGERLAFTQTCTYPEGARVFCASMLELAGGKITHQVSIQAWDA